MNVCRRQDPMQCFKFEENHLGNLQIELNPSKSKAILWNKYRIFIYDELKFKSASKIIVPEYQIYRLILTDNYLQCVDTNGFVHIISLELKNNTQKILKSIYNPLDQGIKACVAYPEDQSLSLKYDEKYYLSLNKINPEFQLVKKATLVLKDSWQIQESPKEKCLITHLKISDRYAKRFGKMFGVENISNKSHFTVISFDNRTIYACLFDEKSPEDQVNVIKLYACPSEICNIKIISSENIYIMIGLNMGTVIKFTLNDLTCQSATLKIITMIVREKPVVLHLKTALHKIIINNNNFICTDGITMWNVERPFCDMITYSQFLVTNVNDIKQIGDKVICTTFNKHIYTFSFLDKNAYLPQTPCLSYIESYDLLDQSDCLDKIFKEVEKGDELARQVSLEGTFLAALALSKSQGLMETIIYSSVTVCGNFEELIKTNKQELTLTENIANYFEPGVTLFYVTVKLRGELQGTLLDLVTSILLATQAEVHITISSGNQILKTTSLKISKINFLIPLKLEDAKDINVNISIIPIVPGTRDETQKIWTRMYDKDYKLTSEHFIKPKLADSLILQKVPEFEEHSILEANEFGNYFDITNISTDVNSYTMYVKVPQNFNAANMNRCFMSAELCSMTQLFNSEEFWQSKSAISFWVGRVTVEVALENDGFSNPQLMITSKNLKITSDIRNFLSNIIYAENPCEPGAEFINNSFYTTVENLQKAVKDCVATSNYEEFPILMKRFEKEVIGMLPV